MNKFLTLTLAFGMFVGSAPFAASAGTTTIIKCYNAADCDKLGPICTSFSGQFFEWDYGKGGVNGACVLRA